MDASCGVLKKRMDAEGYDPSEMKDDNVLDGYVSCLLNLG